MQQNNSSMIRPGGGVQVPSSNAIAGMGQRPNTGAQLGNNNNGYTQQDPLSILRNLAGSSAGGDTSQTGGIRWEQYGANSGYDQALQDIAKGSGPDQDSMQYLVAGVAPANLMFVTQILSRSGQFYEVYRQTVEGFRRSERGHPCVVRDAFISMFVKHQEFTRIVAINSSTLFGWRLIGVKQETNRTELQSNDYFSAAEAAIRSVLFLEMINWLMKTPEGQNHARQLPKDLSDKLPNLPNFISIVDAASNAFGMNNPYASLEFKLPLTVRVNPHNLQYEQGAEYLYGNGLPNAGRGDIDDNTDLINMVMRNAGRHQSPAHVRNDYYDPNSVAHDNSHHWNEIRNDLENITPRNKKEFQLRRFFHNIGKPNHYLITETDWTKIKKHFVKHSEMKAEETVLQYCFRIVIIDLDADSGWFSTIVRTEDYDLPTLLTDPSKLLPLLEDPDETGILSVKAMDVKDIIKDNKLEVPPEVCYELEDVMPLITFSEEVVTNSPREMENTLSAVNNRLTQNFPADHQNAVSFNVKVWDTFTMKSEADKYRLFKDLPFLFTDGVMEKRPTMFEACKTLLGYFKQKIVDNEVCAFIDTRLTTVINDYFINCGGYDSYPHERNFLSVDSLVRDYDELDQHLERRDPMMFKAFNTNDQNNYLTKQLQIFTYENPYEAKPEEGKGTLLDQVKDQEELLLERRLNITYINNRSGPLYKDAQTPIVMKRSRFPEYFELIEQSFEPVMGDAPFDTTDKLISFTMSEDLWLFSYSAIDKNVATLRHVSRKEPLVLLSLN